MYSCAFFFFYWFLGAYTSNAAILDSRFVISNPTMLAKGRDVLGRTLFLACLSISVDRTIKTKHSH